MASLIVQKDAAYLMTDSGLFTPSGMLLALAPKVLAVRSQSLAIATTGSLHVGVLAPLLHSIPDWETCDQEVFVRALPGVVRSFYAGEGLDPDQLPSEVFIALYSRRMGRPMGLSFITGFPTLLQDVEPWALKPCLQALTPGVDLQAVYGRDVRLRDPSFVPWRDALPLVEAQRAVREGWGFMPDGVSAVAGEITLTTVSAAGIEYAALHTYADVEGERVAA
ncbi:hypothetical protein [Sphingosinicella microcystinivorans]|uniref:hypothetical protein n=1 Tax=Sphingosinicella microcystinivorans TaxID=335406 RepID=UPI0022F3920C|nr:hypothetical protein [Sphingosinicella microcystinivorans]WBX83193.1 hypothetical protein PE061_15485 [Sphingosinicella microcystinivorans]